MTELLVKDPIYFQASERLRALLRRGAFAAGAQFLTERQIADRFGISRATANKALASLVAEGVLEFRKGVGTFVRTPLLDYDLRALVSFTEKARAAGKTPATRVLRAVEVTAAGVDPEVRAALGLEPSESVYDVARLRLADGVPVILERRQLLARFCPALDADALAGSLYELLTERYGLRVAGADETIRAVAIGGDDARQLRVDDGAAGLRVTALGFLEGGTPLWFERTLYRGDTYEFRNRLGPVAAAHPAVGQIVSPGREGKKAA